MKKPIPQLLWYFLLSFPVFMLSACSDNMETTRTYEMQIMVPMKASTLRAITIKPEKSRQLSDPGKIYVYDNYLFINEANEGVHVVDNSNPASPQLISFINIPGNVDIAVNNKVLYADSYVDLLAFDISNPRDIKLVKRVEDVFSHLYYDLQEMIFATYKDTVITETVVKYDRNPLFDLQQQGWYTAGEANTAGKNYGQGGSMARFTLMGGHLYAVSDHALHLFDVNKPEEPRYMNEIPLGWGIETIFPYEDKLFIGAMNGMHIYDAAVPSDPVHLSTYEHFTACDPVVVKDSYAFVTLRTGNFCTQSNNELHVIDISDVLRPKLIKAYPMQNPHGLGIAASSLFLCEGKQGLKSFDISDVQAIDKHMLQHLKSIQAIDVIPTSGSLIVTGPEGIYQFDYSSPGKLRQLSLIRTHQSQ